MIKEISKEIRIMMESFSDNDIIIFNNKLLQFDKNKFCIINNSNETKKIAFVDGGQAEIISTGNFCLSLIKVFAQIFHKNKRLNFFQNEFYILTKAKWQNEELYYESKIFTKDKKLFDEKLLFISSKNNTIKIGNERAPITKVSNMARRFAELSLIKEVSDKVDFVLLDGTLTPTFNNEELLLNKLNENVCALAKSSSLFTTSGNSPVNLLNKLGIKKPWSYNLETKSFFVKLNENSQHVFRFEGNKNILPFLIENSNDSLFLGYPYGLIYADKMARITNNEKSSLQLQMLLKSENKELKNFLNNNNAHQILDKIEF